MVNNKVYSKIENGIDNYKSAMIKFQKSLTKLKALSPQNGGVGEWDKVMFIKEFLQKKGITDLQQINAPDSQAKNKSRPSLIARIPGKSDHRTIWIMAHTDVVPAGNLDLWKSDPFEVLEKDGKLYGRGTEDNQQSLTSAVFATIIFKESNIKPEYNIALLLVADEETGSEFGLSYILKNNKNLFKKEDIIIVPDAGESDASMIEVAEKGIVWIKFETKGKQCHASLPGSGINAFKAASELVVKLNSLYKTFNAINDVFEPNISTFEPTKKDANVPNINTIPGYDVFYLDCRLLPEYSSMQVLKKIRKICDKIEQKYNVKIEYSTVQKEDAAPATATDAPVVKMLKNAINHVYKVQAKPMGIGGGTVAAFFRRNGLDAAVWSTIDDVCHQPNEYCVIDNMVNDAKVFAHIFLQKE